LRQLYQVAEPIPTEVRLTARDEDEELDAADAA
jgi:hypothetical protein